MAPRKRASSSSSKAPARSAAVKKVKSAENEKPSAAATNKKRKAEAAPARSSAASCCIDTYVVMKSEGEWYQAPTVSVEGVYPLEDQAYAAAIRKFITELERVYGSEKVELRRIATMKGLSLKQRLKNVQSAGELVEDVLEFRVEKTPAFPQENVDEEKLLDEFQRQEASENEFRSHSGVAYAL